MNITASGGVSSLDDVRQLREMGLYGAIIGKAYYTGTIDLKVWDYSGPVGNAPSDLGKVVKLRGVVSDFKGMPQITVSRRA